MAVIDFVLYLKVLAFIAYFSTLVLVVGLVWWASHRKELQDVPYVHEESDRGTCHHGQCPSGSVSFRSLGHGRVELHCPGEAPVRLLGPGDE